MARPELGKKHNCLNCGAKFYDFDAEEPACPSCGTLVVLETQKRRAQPVAAEAKPPVAEAKIDSDGDGDDEIEDLIDPDLEIDDEDDDFVNLDDDDEDDNLDVIVDDKKGPKLEDE